MNFSHSGEWGDLILSLPAIKALSGGSVYGVDRPWTRPNFRNKIALAKSLLEAQNYIDHVGPHNGERIDIDISPFRRNGLITGQTIVERVARYCRVTADISEPWLHVEPDARSKGRIVINQCPRWTSFFFPWKQIVQTFGDDLLFIGLPEEHKEFCDEFGKMPYLRTNDLHDVARLIRGSELFCGNQSCCAAIAEGLHHPKVLAVCQWACDCFFKRDGAMYCIDGSLSFEACGKSFRSEAARFIPKFNNDGLDKALLIAKCREVMVSKSII